MSHKGWHLELPPVFRGERFYIGTVEKMSSPQPRFLLCNVCHEPLWSLSTLAPVLKGSARCGQWSLLNSGLGRQKQGDWTLEAHWLSFPLFPSPTNPPPPPQLESCTPHPPHRLLDLQVGPCSTGLFLAGRSGLQNAAQGYTCGAYHLGCQIRQKNLLGTAV